MLRDYQIAIADQGTEILRTHRLLYLSMQVRTGKTFTSLAIADRAGAKKVLFVTKKKAISSITDDYDRLGPSFLITVINYESLHNLYLPETFDLVILDEAHSLGQYPTPAERTKLLKEICAGKPIIFLSGTPSPESYSQLYHQFFVSSFSPFAEWTNFYKWAAEFVTKRVKYMYNRQINDYSLANKQKIDDLTRHLFVSYTQEEAGFEQFVQETILFVDMRKPTYDLADFLRRKRVYIGMEGNEVLADTEVKLMNKMHQIYSGSVLDEKQVAIAFDRSKAEFIRDRFAGQKIAIFYKFRGEKDLLLFTFGCDRLTEDPDQFNKGDNLIFISQIQSGREGINLSTADALIMFNIDYSAVSYWQARARLQTKERTKAALLYWVFARGGIEEKIYKTVLDKRDYTLSHFKKDFNIKKNEASTTDRAAGGV